MGSTKTPSPASACLAALAALCAGAAAPASAEDAPAPPPPLPFDARALQAAIDATPDGGTVRLPDGETRLASPVSVVGRTNLTVRGGAGTVLVLHYSPWEEPVWLITPHVLVKDSSGVSFENFRVTTDHPVNASGRVVAKNPGGVLPRIIGLDYEVVGPQRIRVRAPDAAALNVHAKAAEIESFDPATGAISVACRDPGGGKARLPRGWARPGDALAVYDAATLLPKGRLAVTSWRDSGRGIATPVADAAGIAPGDFVANKRDFPSVEISGCTFAKCGMNGSPANLGAVTVKTSHDAGSGNGPAGVHRDLHIIGNTFRGCGAGGVYVESARGVEVRDNAFEDVWRNPPPDAGADRRPVRLRHCDDVFADPDNIR